MFSDFTSRPVALNDRALKLIRLELIHYVTKCMQLNAVPSKEYHMQLHEQTGVSMSYIFFWDVLRGMNIPKENIHHSKHGESIK